ncbi:MAG: hypothetical protein QM796_19770 [Chthoniobacteraceae bacterium]
MARNHGQIVATEELRTAGAPTAIQLSTDRTELVPGWDHIATITATIVDKNGVPVPSAQNLVTFDIQGPGTIIAVDNSNNASAEPFQAHQRHAYAGRCIALVRAKEGKAPSRSRRAETGLRQRHWRSKLGRNEPFYVFQDGQSTWHQKANQHRLETHLPHQFESRRDDGDSAGGENHRYLISKKIMRPGGPLETVEIVLCHPLCFRFIIM